MAQGILRGYNSAPEMQSPVIAANSAVFAEYTPVYKNSSGFLDVASTSSKIWGFCLEEYTAASDNQTVAQYCPLVIGAAGVIFWADADQAWAQTDNDAYCDIASVSAGVVTLNLAGGATGQFAILGLLSDLDPTAEGDTDRIYVTVAEPQNFAFAQS